MSLISSESHAPEDVSIFGTGVSHIPLIGLPSFDGISNQNGCTLARITDGAFALEITDLKVARRWLKAFRYAVHHLEHGQ